MIRVERLVKTYGEGEQRVRALVGVSLAVAPGEFLCVTGASGSGKSTLLHLMGGLDVPESGHVEIKGARLSQLAEPDRTQFRRRHIGLVFQFFNLLPDLTAQQNVALPALLDGVPRREALARAEGLLEQMALVARRGHTPDELSGGERQRVAIARALINGPLVLLADEPTGNLDSQTGISVLELLRGVCEQKGCTLVMVTHDARASSYADRVIVLRDGKIIDEVAARTNGRAQRMGLRPEQ